MPSGEMKSSKIHAKMSEEIEGMTMEAILKKLTEEGKVFSD